MKKHPKKQRIASIEHESSYIRAYEDIELLNKPVMRPVRIELEVMKPELYLQKLDITQTIVCFGSARVRPEKEAKAAEYKVFYNSHTNSYYSRTSIAEISVFGTGIAENVQTSDIGNKLDATPTPMAAIDDTTDNAAGGLSTGATVAIIAGAAVVGAVVGIIVPVILKKKKS